MIFIKRCSGVEANDGKIAFGRVELGANLGFNYFNC